jgi:integrase
MNTLFVIYTRVSKEKAGKQMSVDIAEYVEEEVQKLIESIHSVQKKAFIACMYESGTRQEEFLRFTNSDIRLDSKCAILIMRGKTGERRVRIIGFTKLLQQWLNIHPLKYVCQIHILVTDNMSLALVTSYNSRVFFRQCTKTSLRCITIQRYFYFCCNFVPFLIVFEYMYRGFFVAGRTVSAYPLTQPRS